MHVRETVENPQTCGSCQVACASACRRPKTAFATYVLPHVASLSVRDRARVPFAPAESNLCVRECRRQQGDVREPGGAHGTSAQQHARDCEGRPSRVERREGPEGARGRGAHGHHTHVAFLPGCGSAFKGACTRRRELIWQPEVGRWVVWPGREDGGAVKDA